MTWYGAVFSSIRIGDNVRFEKPQMAGTHFQEGVDLNRLRTDTY
jgi:hypothetical protein